MTYKNDGKIRQSESELMVNHAKNNTTRKEKEGTGDTTSMWVGSMTSEIIEDFERTSIVNVGKERESAREEEFESKKDELKKQEEMREEEGLGEHENNDDHLYETKSKNNNSMKSGDRKEEDDDDVSCSTRACTTIFKVSNMDDDSIKNEGAADCDYNDETSKFCMKCGKGIDKKNYLNLRQFMDMTIAEVECLARAWKKLNQVALDVKYDRPDWCERQDNVEKQLKLLHLILKKLNERLARRQKETEMLSKTNKNHLQKRKGTEKKVMTCKMKDVMALSRMTQGLKGEPMVDGSKNENGTSREEKCDQESRGEEEENVEQNEKQDEDDGVNENNIEK